MQNNSQNPKNGLSQFSKNCSIPNFSLFTGETPKAYLPINLKSILRMYQNKKVNSENQTNFKDQKNNYKSIFEAVDYYYNREAREQNHRHSNDPEKRSSRLQTLSNHLNPQKESKISETKSVFSKNIVGSENETEKTITNMGKKDNEGIFETRNLSSKSVNNVSKYNQVSDLIFQPRNPKIEPRDNGLWQSAFRTAISQTKIESAKEYKIGVIKSS